jgi:hypothetical protein
MQQFLKPAAGAAGARIVAPQFLGQFFVAVDDAPAAFDVRFRGEASAALAGPGRESSVLQIVFALP